MGFKSLEVLQISNLLKGSCIFVELPLRSSVFCTSRKALLRLNSYMVNRPATLPGELSLSGRSVGASFLLNHCASSRFCSCLLFETELCTLQLRILVNGTLLTIFPLIL